MTSTTPASASNALTALGQPVRPKALRPGNLVAVRPAVG